MEPVIPQHTPDTAPTRHTRWRLPALIALVTVIALNLGLVAGYMARQSPVIVSFSMQGTIDQFMDQSASQTLTDTQSEQLVARFTRALEESLAAYQRQHHALILVAPSVVAGARDITREIQQDIALRMRDNLAPSAGKEAH